MKYSDELSVIPIVLILLINCSKGEDTISPVQNKAPQTFSLLSPHINEDNISRLPTFSWEEAIDEEGDKVTYDLYLGKPGESTPISLLAKDLSTTSYTGNVTLDFDKEYQWKVVAKDATGASTSSPVSSFRVQPPPIVFLRRHAIGTTDKYFEYSDDGYLIKLEDSNQDSWNLKYDITTEKLERTYMGMQTAFVYKYSKEGLQETVGKFSIDGSESWMLEYENAYGSLTSVEHLIQELGGTNLDEEVSLVYEDRVSITDTTAPKLVQILIGSVTDSGTISKKMNVEWSGENISKIIVELDTPDGFIFSVSLEFEYDNNVNPYYTIISEQFGFDTFFVGNFETGLETINFGPFYWQSKNNVTKIKKTEQDDNGMRFTTELVYDYMYSKEFYPTLANVIYFNDVTSMEYTEEWSY